MSDLEIGKVYGQVAKALGNRRTSLYVNWNFADRHQEIQLSAPPAFVIGPYLADRATLGEKRFHVARGLELTRPEFILAAAVRPEEFTEFFTGIVKAFHPRHARRRTEGPEAEQVARIKKALPYKVSKQLAELFQSSDTKSFSSALWRSLVHDTGNRAGLLLCGDLRTAVTEVLRAAAREASLRDPLAQDPDEAPVDLSQGALRPQARVAGPLRELVRFALSDAYFELRERLGTCTVRAAAA